MFDDQLPPPTAPAPAGEAHRALYLRWRPQRFEDVVGQDHVTRTLRNAVKLDRLAHAYLLTGPRGTGKTSLARILYRAANCPNAPANDGDPCNACPLCLAALDGRSLDLIEIDAASNRGIDDIRDLRDKVAYRPSEGRYKLYIIDEAHELTTPAWDAFLKTLEEPPPHAIFVLATTAAHKVPPTIVSRCQRFDLRRIPFAAIRAHLARVADQEGMQVDPAVLERLALVARGGLRDALSLLDQLAAFGGGHIDMPVARAALSLPSVEAVRGVLDGLTRRDPASTMAVLSEVAEGGGDVRLFADELVVHLRALLLVRSGADARLGDELPLDEVAWLRERAAAWSTGVLMRLIQTLSEALARTRDAQQFQVQTELALLEACDVESHAPIIVPATASASVASQSAGGPNAAAGMASVAVHPATCSASSAGEAPPRPQPPAASVSPAASASTAPMPAATAPAGGSTASAGQTAALPSAAAPATASGAAAPTASPPAGAEPVVAPSAASVPPVAAASAAAASVLSVAPGMPAADAVPAPAADAPPGPAPSLATLAARWPDVVEHVKGRNPLLASLLGRATPRQLDGAVLTVAFQTEFNRKRAESTSNRKIIEEALERTCGASLRLRGTLASADGAPSLLEDPVINFAARTFGGEPRRVPTDTGAP